MASFAKVTIPAVTRTTVVQAAKQKVTFYVNLYKANDGSIEPGARTFRSARNAQRRADLTHPPGRGLVHVGVRELTVEASV